VAAPWSQPLWLVIPLLDMQSDTNIMPVWGSITGSAAGPEQHGRQ
jgi:hypothetical protein